MGPTKKRPAFFFWGAEEVSARNRNLRAGIGASVDRFLFPKRFLLSEPRVFFTSFLFSYQKKRIVSPTSDKGEETRRRRSDENRNESEWEKKKKSPAEAACQKIKAPAGKKGEEEEEEEEEKGKGSFRAYQDKNNTFLFPRFSQT